MSIGTDSIWPATDFFSLFVASLWSGPNGHVVVEEVCQVVLDQVLPGHSKIQGIPVIEFTT